MEVAAVLKLNKNSSAPERLNANSEEPGDRGTRPRVVLLVAWQSRAWTSGSPMRELPVGGAGESWKSARGETHLCSKSRCTHAQARFADALLFCSGFHADKRAERSGYANQQGREFNCYIQYNQFRISMDEYFIKLQRKLPLKHNTIYLLATTINFFL